MDYAARIRTSGVFFLRSDYLSGVACDRRGLQSPLKFVVRPVFTAVPWPEKGEETECCVSILRERTLHSCALSHSEEISTLLSSEPPVHRLLGKILSEKIARKSPV
jgi:hypothetical protein